MKNTSRLGSLKVAFEGLLHTITHQRNFQIQIAVGFMVVLLAFWFGFSRFEWLILIITITLVLAAEILNTVVEIVIDLAVKEQLLPDAKLAKDVSAAAVLLIALFAVLVGIILFAPYLF